ncbi:hypothetical protein ACFV5J_30620 [Streptomyces zaomyceticus]|uniref:hypothetical protein n=1 Tax=Streptomyces zaomyceticus TaxID=68286 RepID=UPI003654D1BE
MGEEPTWGEFLLNSLLAMAVPTLVGGALVVSLVGLTVWATAPLRRRRRSRATESGAAVPSPGRARRGSARGGR